MMEPPEMSVQSTYMYPNELDSLALPPVRLPDSGERQVTMEVPTTVDHRSILQSEDMQQRILVARVRTQRAKLLDRVKASGTCSGDYQGRVVALLQIDCSLSVLYEKLDIRELIVANCQDKKGIEKLVSAFTILEKYGRNLLKPAESRPSMWKTVQFANGVFRDRVDCIQGSRTILQQMGYKKLLGSSLSFADGSEPDVEAVAIITAEVVLARSELELYLKGTHPYPQRVEQHLPASAWVPQQGPVPIVSNKSPLLTGGVPSVPAAAAAACRVPMTSAEPKPGVQPRLEMGEYKRILESTNIPATSTPGLQQGALVAAAGEPGHPTAAWAPQQNDDAAVSYCDICGAEAARWGCDICDDKKLCAECDDKWHRHPRRQNHRRQRLAAEVICDICGQDRAHWACNICQNKLCEGCDVTWHSHTKRANHQREHLGPAGDGVPRPQVPSEQGRRPFVFQPNPVQIPLPRVPPQSTVTGSQTIPTTVEATSAQRTSQEVKRVSDERIPRLSIFNEGLSSSGGGAGDIALRLSGQVPAAFQINQTGDAAVGAAISQIPNKTPDSAKSKSRVTFDLDDQSSNKSSDLELSVDLSGELIDPLPFIEPDLENVLRVAEIQAMRDLEQKKSAVSNALRAVKNNISVIENALQNFTVIASPNARHVEQNLNQKKQIYLKEKEMLENFQKLQLQMEQVPRLRGLDRSPGYKNQIRYPPSTYVPPDVSFPSSSSSMGTSRYPTVSTPAYYPPGAVGYVSPSPAGPFLQHSPNAPFTPSSSYIYSGVPISPVPSPLTPVHKGVCPNCQALTNYYRETCHECGKKIPDYIKEVITPPPYTPVFPPSVVYSQPEPPQMIRTTSTSSTSSAASRKSVSSFQGHPLAWECEHCTMINEAGTRVCTVCDRTSEKPRFVEEELEPEDKMGASGYHGSGDSPVTKLDAYVAREQEKAEEIALEKKRAQEEFRRQLEQEEAERLRQSATPPSVPRGLTSVGNRVVHLEREEIGRVETQSPVRVTGENVAIDPAGKSSEMSVQGMVPIVPAGVSSAQGMVPSVPAGVSSAQGMVPSVPAGVSPVKPNASECYQDARRPTEAGRKSDLLTRVGSEEVELSGGPSLGSSGSEAEEGMLKVSTQKQMEMLAEKKRQNQLAVEGMQWIRLIRQAEARGHCVEEVEVASSHSDGTNPLNWLETEWKLLVDEVLTKVSELNTDYDGEHIDRQQVGHVLAKHKGDIDGTVRTCMESQGNKLAELMQLGHFEEDRARAELKAAKGNVEVAYQHLINEALTPFLERIWVEEEDLEEEEEECEAPADLSLMRLSTSFADLRALGVITSDAFEARVRNKDLDYEARLRLVLVEGHLQSWGRAETVLRIVDMDDLEVDVTLEDIIEAVRNCGNILDSLMYLQQECQVCFSKFPASKIKIMGLCQCPVCSECMSSYLEIHIRERHLRVMVCPVCSEPDMENMELREAHFSFLALMLQNLVGADLQELFQKKLCDWALMQDPNFRWCSHCEEGFIFNSVNGQLKMKCCHCNRYTCFSCKKTWEPQHADITCERFQEWKEANDPDRQALGLARHLEENGIDCPGCKFHYVLAKGGCMHFTCTQCRFEFCSGCSNPFRRNNCTVLESCARAGLHCHHPRNCFFYLRDYSMDQLQQLLQSKAIRYNTAAPAGHHDICPVMEQKETVDGLKDEACGRAVAVNQEGLCEIHYKEYLVGLVNANKIDPVDIMTVKELQNLLRKYEKDIPECGNQSADQYKTRLIQAIHVELPLPVLGLTVHI